MTDSVNVRLKRTKEIIINILQEKKSLTKFHISKLLYLYDLTCIQLNIDACTGLPFIWHQQGPYCIEIEKAIWQLEDAKKISIRNYTSTKGHECLIHELIAPGTPTNLTEIEKQIIKYLVKEYAPLKYQQLRDFVYATPPMVKAQKGKRFEKIDMKAQSKNKNLYNKEMAQMIFESNNTSRSKYIPIDNAIKMFEHAFLE